MVEEAGATDFPSVVVADIDEREVLFGD